MQDNTPTQLWYITVQSGAREEDETVKTIWVVSVDLIVQGARGMTTLISFWLMNTIEMAVPFLKPRHGRIISERQ